MWACINFESLHSHFPNKFQRQNFQDADCQKIQYFPTSGWTMSSNPPPGLTGGPPSAGIPQSQTTFSGNPLIPEQSQPVDLATTSKQPLRIPTVPRPTLNPPRAILGGTVTTATPLRGQTTSRPLLAVPKAQTGAGPQQVNLAVMNKVTVLTTTNPPTKPAGPLSGANVPRATATTIVRPPTSFPLSIKSSGGGNPLGAGLAGNATSIR